MIELLTRFVVAVEKMASALSEQNAIVSRLTPTMQTSNFVPTVQDTAKLPSVEYEGGSVPDVGNADNDREAIKKELDARGIKYGARARTETLAALLEQSKADPAETSADDPAAAIAPSDDDDLFGEEAPAEKTYTTDEVRAALQAYASNAEKTAKAKEFLRDLGSASLKDLPKEQYSALMAKLEG